jgi:hypothetical protein
MQNMCTLSFPQLGCLHKALRPQAGYLRRRGRLPRPRQYERTFELTTVSRYRNTYERSYLSKSQHAEKHLCKKGRVVPKLDAAARVPQTSQYKPSQPIRPQLVQRMPNRVRELSRSLAESLLGHQQ